MALKNMRQRRTRTILTVTCNPELAAQTGRVIRVKDGLIDGSLNQGLHIF